MARIPQEEIDRVQTVLKQEKVFTLNRLLSLLDFSARTGQTKLKQWGAHNSYNQNGRYYALPGVPEFDVHGLWRHEGIFFSRYGNLKKTVIHLIRSSEAGLSGSQIGQLIGLTPRSFLHHFREVSGIRREKQEGVYVYFSDTPDRFQTQWQNRARYGSGQRLTFADVVVILTAIIKANDISIQEIMALPEVKARRLSDWAVREFLERHDLLKKMPVLRP